MDHDPSSLESQGVSSSPHPLEGERGEKMRDPRNDVKLHLQKGTTLKMSCKDPWRSLIKKSFMTSVFLSVSLSVCVSQSVGQSVCVCVSFIHIPPVCLSVLSQLSLPLLKAGFH